MTEQELNNRITEILKVSEKDARLCQTSGGRRTGRQYRRIQRARHDDRLLFLIQHSGYAPNISQNAGARTIRALMICCSPLLSAGGSQIRFLEGCKQRGLCMETYAAPFLTV